MSLSTLDAKLQMLKELTDANGVAGFEHEPREVMRKYITPLADEVVTDNLGSLIAVKTGDPMVQELKLLDILMKLDLWLHKLMTKDFYVFKQLVAGGPK